MRTIIFLISFLLFSVYVSGQHVSYGYDAAGNRISRVIVIDPLQAPEAAPAAPPVYSEMLKQTEIRIYPNPTEGLLKVEIVGLDTEKNNRLMLYDMSGNLILNRDHIDSSTDLDISNRLPGTYILRIFAGEDKTEWKIIKK